MIIDPIKFKVTVPEDVTVLSVAEKQLKATHDAIIQRQMEIAYRTRTAANLTGAARDTELEKIGPQNAALAELLGIEEFYNDVVMEERQTLVSKK